MTILARFRRRTPLGWLQLKREPARLLAAIAGIAFADLLMFLQLGVLSALYETTVQVHRVLNADVVLVSPQARDILNPGSIPRVRLFQALSEKGVTSGEPVYISFLDWTNPYSGYRGAMTLIGVDPCGHAILLPAIAEQLPRLTLSDSALFDRASRGDQRDLLSVLDHGQMVSAEIQRRTIVLTGSFSLGAAFGSDGQLIVSPDTFLHLYPPRDPGSISLGLLRVEPGINPSAFASSLNRRLPNDVRALTKTQLFKQLKIGRRRMHRLLLSSAPAHLWDF